MNSILACVYAYFHCLSVMQFYMIRFYLKNATVSSVIEVLIIALSSVTVHNSDSCCCCHQHHVPGTFLFHLCCIAL